MRRREFFIRRRDLFIALGSAAIASPVTSLAQQQPKLPTVGVLGGDPSVWNAWTTAFVERLHALGWVEGRTIAFKYGWSEAHAERVAKIATEMVDLKVNVIVTATPWATIVKQATSDIPIVLAIGNDPVGTGLVASLARPGGNVTGLSIEATDLAGKRLELLREVVPRLRRLAIMADLGDPDEVIEVGVVQATARKLDIDVTLLDVRKPEDISSAFANLKEQPDGLYVVQGPLVGSNRTRVITLALGARLPTMFSPRDHVKAGALMSYGPNFPDLFRRAAEYVDKILRGAKPADLPIEQPTKFDFVINLTTAKALGLNVPQSLIARADEVIE